MSDTVRTDVDQGQPAPAAAQSPAQLIAGHLAAVIGSLQEQYVAGPAPGAWAQSTLAQLRAGDINDPGAGPSSWQLVFEDLPPALAGRGDRPSRAERVIHQVLTLYAVHQQGRRPDRMHVADRSVGRAVRDLALATGGAEPNPGVISRFHRLVTTTDESMRLVHLRSLIGMLRAQRLPLDHGMLGRDLFQLARPDARTRIHLRWARDLHRRPVRAQDTASETTAEHHEESTS